MDATKDTDRVGEAVVRETALADGCQLLAMLLQFPTDELVEGLANGSVRQDAAAIMEEAGVDEGRRAAVVESFERVQEAVAAADRPFDDVRWERTRLFDHPEHPVIRLYEGVFLDDERERAGRKPTGARLFVNPAALDAERCYRRSGFKRSGDLNIPADCITTELEFAARLHALRAVALAEADARRTEELDGAVAEFERIHASKWHARFFERCEGESRHPLYRAVGALGGALAAMRADRVEGS